MRRKWVIGAVFSALLVMISSLGLENTRPEEMKALDGRWLAEIPVSVMGPFRSILVDLWWMKVDDQRQAYRFDLVDQSTKAICRLNPYVPESWQYLAWNMAFNLCADNAGNREVQFAWIVKGLKHIQEGLEKNPVSPTLHYAYAETLFFKSTIEPHFCEELKEYLGQDPIQLAVEYLENCDLVKSRDLTLLRMSALILKENGRMVLAEACEKRAKQLMKERFGK